MKKNKKPDFKNFVPSSQCYFCEGRGEVKDDYVTSFFSSSYWTYKKCSNCNRTGKNLFSCLYCKSPLIIKNSFFWCSNIHCKYYNLAVVLGSKEN